MATVVPRRPARSALGALAVLLLALVFVAGTARTASAADGYKYWNYFHVTDGKYVFAQTGPADYTPKDGAVEAYRYGLSTAADGLPPRTDATTYTVEDICAGTEAKEGQKLVGVLIDYGTAADADSGATPPDPRAACAAVPTNANGQQVLDAVADVRLDKSLTCGIDGYPVKGCSVTVKSPPAAAAEQSVDFALPKSATDDSSTAPAASDESASDSSGFPWTLVVVVVVVVVLAAGGLLLSRRSKNA
jgi:hypothetical protein